MNFVLCYKSNMINGKEILLGGSLKLFPKELMILNYFHKS